MKKIYKIFISFLVLLAVSASSTFAQIEQDNLESCFAYYDYGKLQANLATKKTSYTPGETAKIHGIIVNNNTFPLVDVVLYAHIKRINRETFSPNGHFLIDRITLAENLAFLPLETKGIDTEFPILNTYPNGDYQLHYFLFSKHGFHYGGRPFLEEDVAGYSTFKIENGVDPFVYFDLDSLFVNGQPHTIRELITEYGQGSVSFSIGLVDLREKKTDIQAKVKWYSFEDTFESLLVSQENIDILPDDPVLPTVFKPVNSGAYVMLIEIDKPMRSLFKYRFAVSGETAVNLRMNDLGITSFPAESNGRAWVCFHSPTEKETAETKLTLSLLDSNKQLVEEKTISGLFAPEVYAVSLPVNKLTTTTDFWVKSQFIQVNNPAVLQTVELHYDCNKFASSLASLETGYDNKTNSLSLNGQNTCGGQVARGGFIESIKIKDKAGNVKKEAYNLAAIPQEFSLEGLSEGSYQAEVVSGNKAKTFNFDILTLSAKKKRPPDIFLILLLIIIAIPLIGILSFFIWERYEKK